MAPAKIKILAIDDDRDMLILMRYALQNQGFEVSISVNALNMSKIIAENLPDVILMDIHMDGVDGQQLCKELKHSRNTSDIPIILLSANTNIAEVKKACGADAFLQKPFKTTDIVSQIVQLKLAG